MKAQGEVKLYMEKFTRGGRIENGLETCFVGNLDAKRD